MHCSARSCRFWSSNGLTIIKYSFFLKIFNHQPFNILQSSARDVRVLKSSVPCSFRIMTYNEFITHRRDQRLQNKRNQKGITFFEKNHPRDCLDNSRYKNSKNVIKKLDSNVHHWVHQN